MCYTFSVFFDFLLKPPIKFLPARLLGRLQHPLHVSNVGQRGSHVGCSLQETCGVPQGSMLGPFFFTTTLLHFLLTLFLSLMHFMLCEIHTDAAICAC